MNLMVYYFHLSSPSCSCFGQHLELKPIPDQRVLETVTVSQNCSVPENCLSFFSLLVLMVWGFLTQLIILCGQLL